MLSTHTDDASTDMLFPSADGHNFQTVFGGLLKLPDLARWRGILLPLSTLRPKLHRLHFFAPTPNRGICKDMLPHLIRKLGKQLPCAVLLVYRPIPLLTISSTIEDIMTTTVKRTSTIRADNKKIAVVALNTVACHYRRLRIHTVRAHLRITNRDG